MLNIYIYDGTFEGLLSSVFDAWNDKDIYSIRTTNENKEVNLLENLITIETREEKADRIIKWVNNKAGYEVLRKLYRVYLTENPDRGIFIFRYLKLIQKFGKNTENNLAHKDVINVNKLSSLHTSETRRLYGFVRFDVLSNDILFAQIEPEYNQLEIVAPFFADRYYGNPWIIHDTKRKTAAIFDGRQYIITESDNNMPTQTTQSDRAFKEMWVDYLGALTIKERLNLELQQKFVPLKIRKYLTEFNFK